MPNLKFETERLVIKELSLDVIDDFYDLQSNKNVLEFVGSPVSTMEDCIKEIPSLQASYSDDKAELLVWGIENKLTGDFIGTCAYVREEGNEIGYRLREIHWGHGYGSELTKGLIDFVFNEYPINEIWAEADELNIASVKILDKNLVNQGKRWNEKDNCWDFHYLLTREEHEKKRN
jgi:ribosomal-protein-alanine N-acetyltransferase